MVIERSFGDLKNPWLRLSNLKTNIELANKIIAVCCYLYNICIEHGHIKALQSTSGLLPYFELHRCC